MDLQLMSDLLITAVNVLIPVGLAAGIIAAAVRIIRKRKNK